MSRLGQLLVRQGWASPADVERALGTQIASETRLGTCLLESRVLTEDLLLKALSEQHQVPGAGVEDLREIPEEVVASLPASLASRCKAVPFRAFGTQAHVAMLDPRNLNCQDELAFALGKRVRPFVATEARLMEALERYYGVPCPPRLQTLLQRLDRARYSSVGPASGVHPAPTSAGARSRRLWEQPEAALFSEEYTRPAPPPPHGSGGGPGPGAATASASAVATEPAPPAQHGRPARPTRPSSVSLTEEERRQIGIDRTEPEPAAPAAEESQDEDGDETQPIPAEAPPLPISFAEAEERLAHCSTPDQVANLLVGFLGQRFERVALFKILRDRVVGWRGGGASLDPESLEEFSADFGQPSIFLNLRTSGNFYLGPLPPMTVHRVLARSWGGSLPRQCLVLPVRIHGRLVTAIYLDRGPEGLGKLDLDALLHLAVATAETYERCILRKKKD